MKALRIEVDFRTGARAAGVDPRRLIGDPTWQNLAAGVEIRLCTDADAAQFQGAAGVTVLDGKKAIEAALAADCPPRASYKVTSEALLNHSLKERQPDLSALGDSPDHQDVLAALHSNGVLGIQRVVRARASVAEVAARLKGR